MVTTTITGASRFKSICRAPESVKFLEGGGLVISAGAALVALPFGLTPRRSVRQLSLHPLPLEDSFGEIDAIVRLPVRPDLMGVFANDDDRLKRTHA